MAITGQVVSITDVLSEIGQVGLWLQAIGVAVVIVVIFDVISFFYNRKKLRALFALKKDINRIERKLDDLAKKKK